MLSVKERESGDFQCSQKSRREFSTLLTLEAARLSRVSNVLDALTERLLLTVPARASRALRVLGESINSIESYNGGLQEVSILSELLANVACR